MCENSLQMLNGCNAAERGTVIVVFSKKLSKSWTKGKSIILKNEGIVGVEPVGKVRVHVNAHRVDVVRERFGDQCVHNTNFDPLGEARSQFAQFFRFHVGDEDGLKHSATTPCFTQCREEKRKMR